MNSGHVGLLLVVIASLALTLTLDTILSTDQYSGTPHISRTLANKTLSVQDMSNDQLQHHIKQDPELRNIFYLSGIEKEIKNSVHGTPFRHLDNFKNPCWLSQVVHRDDNISDYKNHHQKIYTLIRDVKKYRGPQDIFLWRARCLPYFYILGVSKSGTTDLYKRLEQHRDIVTPKVKELHFWERRLKYDQKHPQFQLSVYLDDFGEQAEAIYHNTTIKDGIEYHQKITVDGTPSTLWTYDEWFTQPGNIGLDAPRYLAAHGIKSLTPHAKHIIILREPANRLYSHYHMVNPTGSPIRFHGLVEQAVQIWNDCVSSRGIRHCAYNTSLIPFERLGKHKPCGIYLRASMYTVFIKDWLQVFSREQFLILRAEDYFANNSATLERVFKFLDVERPDVIEDSMTERETFNTAAGRGIRRSPMFQETRKLLHQLFSPMKEELASLLSDDAFLWQDVSS